MFLAPVRHHLLTTGLRVVATDPSHPGRFPWIGSLARELVPGSTTEVTEGCEHFKRPLERLTSTRLNEDFVSYFFVIASG